MRSSTALILLGLILVGIGSWIIGATFWPVVKLEVGFTVSQITKPLNQENYQSKDLIPRDVQFGIVIPKIKANASIIANVDPFDANAYQLALTKGVAHALGSSLPGEKGNMFLFSHSSVNFFEASRYNSIFYLLNKLENGDEIFIYYKNQKYKYLVKQKRQVSPSQVKYLDKGSDNALTLMTCWPSGTTLKRLIIEADLELATKE